MNCKNCGAPLHGSKCDYCGSSYEELVPIIHYQVETCQREVETLAFKSYIPIEYLENDSKVLIERKVKEDMVCQLSRKLLDYMDIETWVDPVTLRQCIGGRLKVVRPL